MQGEPATLVFRLFCELKDVENNAISTHRDSFDGAPLWCWNESMAARSYGGMGGIRSYLEDCRWRQDQTDLWAGKRRGLSSTAPEDIKCFKPWIHQSWLSILRQTKTIETTLEALAVDNNSNLPPLMNPTMLEASDDLTNLSHLNEPAGMDPIRLL